MKVNNFIYNIIKKKTSVHPPGMVSVCSSNSFVLEASIQWAKAYSLPLLIESTCNQVNQFGGYTGLTPIDFIKFVTDIANNNRFPPGNIIFGGDHLGPSPWKNESVEQAMMKAKRLVKDYLEAGYNKIHLDTSMACGGDPDVLSKEVISRRQAELCLVSENTHLAANNRDELPIYVLGTEVPTPGGALKEGDEIIITSSEETEENIYTAQQVLYKNDLASAWDRTIAFVVQPGVEFSDSEIHDYQREKASHLSRTIKNYPNLVYEAHSTDYQTRQNLRDMVEDHFAILKVGPALTFALREALFSLGFIEKELIHDKEISSMLIETLEEAMKKNRIHWENHYSGNEKEKEIKRKFSYSDRCRYYWSEPMVINSINRLLENFSDFEIPLSLISQFLPNQYDKIRSGFIKKTAIEIIQSKITDVLTDYLFACFPIEFSKSR